MNYPATAKMLKAIADTCGITKKVNPHSFRHARATDMASKMTEYQMNQYFGWIQGSEMPATYVHLSGRDLDNTILAMHGLVKESEVKQELNTKLCPRCELLNPNNVEICRRCGMILEERKAAESETKEKEVLGLLNNPKIIAQLLELLKERAIKNE